MTKRVRCDIIVSVVEVWLSLVEYFVRDEGVAGSNPVTSTKTDRLSTVLSVYKFVYIHIHHIICAEISALIRGISSAGRARGSQSRGQGFDPPILHQKMNRINMGKSRVYAVFFMFIR